MWAAEIARSFGSKVSGAIDNVLAAMQTVSLTSAVIETGAIETGASILATPYTMGAAAADWVGADDFSDSMNSEANEILTAGDTLAAAESAPQIQAFTSATAARNQLADVVSHLDQPGSLPALYDIATGKFTGLLSFSVWVAQLPFIGDQLVDAVKAIEDELREWVRQQLEAWWNSVVVMLETEIDEAISGITGPTEVEPDASIPGLTSNMMTAPSHTGIAKDFEEDGAEMDGGATHEGAALSGIAQDLAERATVALLSAFRTWDGSKGGMDPVVDQWFAHPADNRELWEQDFLTAIQSDVELKSTILSRLR